MSISFKTEMASAHDETIADEWIDGLEKYAARHGGPQFFMEASQVYRPSLILFTLAESPVQANNPGIQFTTAVGNTNGKTIAKALADAISSYNVSDTFRENWTPGNKQVWNMDPQDYMQKLRDTRIFLHYVANCAKSYERQLKHRQTHALAR